MWTLRRGHRHIGPDTLAEYMDGRLDAVARTRVDQQLAFCADCRVELEELQATVSLLQQLPVEPVPRSFTMPAPPVQAAYLRPSAPLRMPQWVYAGAASAAAVVLAVLISADATGLLGPGTPQVAPGIAVEAERATASPDQAIAIQESVPAPAITVEVEQQVSVQSAAAAPQVVAAQAAPEAALAAPEAALPAPEAAQAAPEVALAQAMPTPMPAVGSGRDVESAKTPPPTAASSVPAPPGADLPTAKPGPGLAPVVEPRGTATVWRVVEGIAAVLGLVFLGGLLLRRRSQRGVRPG